MTFELTNEQKTLQKDIIRFAREYLNEHVQERDKNESFDRRLWDLSGEQLRLPGLAIPEEYGGRGFDSLTAAMGLEALGYGSEDNGFSFAIAAHMLACAIPIWKFASDELRQKYLADMCNGKLICANSITEPNAGSDSNGIQTRAEKTDGGYIINGNKIFITSAPVSDISLLYASTDNEKGFFGGLTAFIVENNSPGFKTDLKLGKMGLRTAPFGEQVLENVFVPEENRVGQVGGGGLIFNYSMEWERACLGAAHVGAMQRMTELIVKWAKKHEFNGQPLGKEQGIAHKIANMKVSLEAARLLCYKGAWQLDHTKLVSLDASISKLYVSEALNNIARNALDIMGVDGYKEDNDLARNIRDAASAPLYSGTSEMQRNIIARWMGV